MDSNEESLKLLKKNIREITFSEKYDWKLVDIFITKKEINFNAPDTFYRGCSPLGMLVFYANLECVDILLKYGVNINIGITKDDTTPLFIACQQGYIELVQLLINNGANINHSKIDGTTPLYIACENGHTDIVQFLINNGANINQSRIDNGKTPLYIACQNDEDKIVQLLINNGAVRTEDEVN